MAIHVVPYEPEHVPAVRAMNRRMGEAGSAWGFYDEATPDWLASGASPNVRRDFYVATEEDGTVRAGYCLKPEQFLLRGEPCEFASIQGPVSEGLVNPAYGALAFQLIRDMETRASRLFGWGASDRALELLLRLQWQKFNMPFQLHIRRPFRFLRRNAFLRLSSRNRLVLDLLAFTGAGAIGVALVQTALRLSVGKAPRVEVAKVDSFGPWADDIWRSAAPQYGLIALRDQATLNAKFPQGGWPHATILQMQSGGRAVGWVAVLDTPFKDDRRFGNLRVGSVIDALAEPGFETSVIRAATKWLRRQGVDAIATTFTHPTWRSAFRAAGFISSENRRVLLFNPEAADTIGDETVVTNGLHLAPVDGDGPRGF
jgi:hypothetical protein